MISGKSKFAALVLAANVSGSAQAALVDRGGGLIYDTDLNVTWLQDANFAATQYAHSGGVLGYADGQMTWSEAVSWAANLSYFDSVRNVTYTDWRLPTTTDTGAPGMQCTYNGTDCGYNVDPASSEMAHLFFIELGNKSYYKPALVWEPGYGLVPVFEPEYGLVNTGPFSNFQSNPYWSGTEYAPYSNDAWSFRTNDGWQAPNMKNDGILHYALAVRPGDVAAVPEVQTYALMLTGLLIVGAAARRRKPSTVMSVTAGIVAARRKIKKGELR